MGAAVAEEPLAGLYEREPSGILRLTATHQTPGSGNRGRGRSSTGGGGGDDGTRTDFVDTLAFQQVRTDWQGRATVALPLSDDLTSWHLSATALTGRPGHRRRRAAAPGRAAVLRRGDDRRRVPGDRPADDPVAGLRRRADHRGPGDVHGQRRRRSASRRPGWTGRAFVDVDVPLPRPDRRSSRPDASTATTAGPAPDGRPLSDRLARTVTVVTSRLTSTADRLAGPDDRRSTCPVEPT